MNNNENAVLNVPNSLTAIRLILAFVVFGLISQQQYVAAPNNHPPNRSKRPR